MSKQPGTFSESWMRPTNNDLKQLIADAKRIAPEMFGGPGRILSLVRNKWRLPSRWFHTVSPVDGRPMPELPNLSLLEAAEAVEDAADEFAPWASRPLTERANAVHAANDALRANRDTLVGLLAWEIGKTIPAAQNDVDRCIASIDWYLENVGPMVQGRNPLGLISNISSWNHPFSVLLANVVVQALVGNSTVAKIPTLGGGVSLSLAFALLRRNGLPVTLVGGRGGELSKALVGHSAVAGLAFVGGRVNGAAVAADLRQSGKRYALEMEGVNAYVITSFSDWKGLATQIRAEFDFGKQRSTAYTRWVVERSLVAKFVDTYVDAVVDLRVGHPFLGHPIDFGPLISAGRADELRRDIDRATATGALVLYQGQMYEDDFELGQDRRAYLAPTLLYGVRPPTELYHREPFGPVDILVSVGSDDELIAEANVAGGALVASIATDEPARATALAGRLDAFKIGINRLRSRGDKEESFGGTGSSWEGAFVGGVHLVRAFTDGSVKPDGRWLTAS